MRYKVLIENLTDPTDRIELEGDAAVMFVGKIKIEDGTIEHGMAFAGNKRIMAEVLASIPHQVSALAQDEIAKAKQGQGN